MFITNAMWTHSPKLLQKAAQRPTKAHFFPYKQVSGINGDYE